MTVTALITSRRLRPRRWISGLLLLATVALLPSAAAAPAGRGSPEPELAEGGATALAGLVWDYVMARDGAQAAPLLDAISDHPLATVEHVQDILRAGPRYQAQPVGVLPGQPVRSRNRQHSYGLFVPPSYTPVRAYPLILCLHGAGFTGDAYLERWRPRLGERYILACPTLARGDWWTRTAEHLVLATLRTVAARYRIDPNRVYLTGMSNGGIGAWLIGAHHAPLFAGLSPMASGLDEVLLPFVDNLRNTPAYILHGRQDQVMPVRLSRTLAERLDQLGYPHIYREHDRTHPVAGGHFFPREELPALVAWLGAQRRPVAPTTVTVVRDASHLTAFGWVRIDATDRIAVLSENLIDARDTYLTNRIYARLEATVDGPGRIAVRTERVRRFTLFLNEDLIDLTGPVTVLVNGRVVHEGPVRAEVTTLLRQARQRREWSALYPVELRLSVPG